MANTLNKKRKRKFIHQKNTLDQYMSSPCKAFKDKELGKQNIIPASMSTANEWIGMENNKKLPVIGNTNDSTHVKQISNVKSTKVLNNLDTRNKNNASVKNTNEFTTECESEHESTSSKNQLKINEEKFSKLVSSDESDPRETLVKGRRKSTNKRVGSQKKSLDVEGPSTMIRKNIYVKENQTLLNDKSLLPTSPKLLKPIKKYMIPPTTKIISASSFKEVVHNLCYADFCEPYGKLNTYLVPECCDLVSCERNHKNSSPKEISTFRDGPLFNILDNLLTVWQDYDIPAAVLAMLRPWQYLRGDILRILFQYVLDGPYECLMWDIKLLFTRHFDIHPPCTIMMRRFYLQLLDQPYTDEPYFKVLKLTDMGLFTYVMHQLEECYKLDEPFEKTTDGSLNHENDKSDSIEKETLTKITFASMQERYHNFKPLLEQEYNEVMVALDKIRDDSTKQYEMVLNEQEALERLVLALELLVDLLETDFLICVSKLKANISRGTGGVEHLPLIKDLASSNDLNNRVFSLYAKNLTNNLLTQLSRLVGLLAEEVHLFRLPSEKLWQYPNLHSGCTTFTCAFTKAISQCDWSDCEKLERLRKLRPAWLQRHVAMAWINSELNVNMGTDLSDVVDLIHLHVKNPTEKDVIKVKNDDRVPPPTSNFLKKANKKNKYGETMLHKLCKTKQSVSAVKNVLILPNVDVNAKDNYGWTALHEAVNSLSIIKTKILLEYQPPSGKAAVDIVAQNHDGLTPLHEAVAIGSLELCKLLVKHGGVSLLRKQDKNGTTPLELAKRNVDINTYFQEVLEHQEQLNMSADSLLNLSDHQIQLLMVACDAFLTDHHTLDSYCLLKCQSESGFNERKSEQTSFKEWIVVDQMTLLQFRKDQVQFKKLRKILSKLAENPNNPALVRLWNAKFKQGTFEVNTFS